MYSFKNDYSEGAHVKILNALIKSNLEQTEGYGYDKYTTKAIEILKCKIKKDDVDIHFFTGGTATNLVSISAFLKPYEAAISANTEHILVHETGAIEATGHKVISIETSDGKLNPNNIKSILNIHSDEHMVKSKLVYISNPTEIGSLYSKNELKQLSDFCKRDKFILFVDGARLDSALCSYENDIYLPDYGKLTDAFYIGGTKNGALLGEALVICNDSLKKDFRFNMKQKGALMAKGRIIGIQFMELFNNNLYFDLAKHANYTASILSKEISLMGYTFLTHSPSNQIFPILPNDIIKKLQEKYLFYVWSKIADNHSSIRLVTSWATERNSIESFIKDLKILTN